MAALPFPIGGPDEIVERVLDAVRVPVGVRAQQWGQRGGAGVPVDGVVPVPHVHLNLDPIARTMASQGFVAVSVNYDVDGPDLDELRALFREQEYSRIPVYGENLDNILGIVYVKDLIQLTGAEADERPITGLVRPAMVVPETKRLPELLTGLQVFDGLARDGGHGADGFGARGDDLIVRKIQDRGHRSLPLRHGLLHRLRAEAHQRHGVVERQYARGDQRRVLAEAVAGNDGRHGAGGVRRSVHVQRQGRAVDGGVHDRLVRPRRIDVELTAAGRSSWTVAANQSIAAWSCRPK